MVDLRGTLYWLDNKTPVRIQNIGEELPEGSFLEQPDLSEEELAIMENAWVASEMMYADKQVNLHFDEDERAILTIEDWKEYRRTLRDYVKDGVITLEERPVRPDNVVEE